jgi:hypothetical protein
MQLPFTTEQFYAVFRAYNTSCSWGAHRFSCGTASFGAGSS